MLIPKIEPRSRVEQCRPAPRFGMEPSRQEDRALASSLLRQIPVTLNRAKQRHQETYAALQRQYDQIPWFSLNALGKLYMRLELKRARQPISPVVPVYALTQHSGIIVRQREVWKALEQLSEEGLVKLHYDKDAPQGSRPTGVELTPAGEQHLFS